MLQSSSNIRNMDSRYPRENRPIKKDEKDSKNKSTDSPSADTSSRKQSSSTQQTSSAKKDQNHQQGGSWRRGGERRQGRGHDSPATDVNATAVKKEEKDLSQVECYNCHQKGHYATKYPQKSKN